MASHRVRWALLVPDGSSPMDDSTEPLLLLDTCRRDVTTGQRFTIGMTVDALDAVSVDTVNCPACSAYVRVPPPPWDPLSGSEGGSMN